MRMIHVEFAKTGENLSGGEKCTIENIKYFQSKGIRNVLLTTDNGKKVYESLGLCEGKFMKYYTISSYEFEKRHHIFLSYIYRTRQALKLVKYFRIFDNDVLFCHSEFFPNSIPFYFLSRKSDKTKLFYWFHMLAPSLFKGYEGEYTNRYNLPDLALIHYKINQLVYRLLTKSRGIILTVNPFYKNILSKLYPKNFVYDLKKYSGVKTIKNLNNAKKIYDLVWMGRFHKQKGLFEIPEILDILKKYKEDISLAIIGGGDKKIQDRFLKIINERNLGSNVKLFGHISSDDKFRIIQSSKIFIFPSYYESFGQVALEAMANGLPVISYDLPVYVVFSEGIIKVPLLNNMKFAEEIVKLLRNKKNYSEKSKDALEYASTFSWEKTGKEIYNLI